MNVKSALNLSLSSASKRSLEQSSSADGVMASCFFSRSKGNNKGRIASSGIRNSESPHRRDGSWAGGSRTMNLRGEIRRSRRSGGRAGVEWLRRVHCSKLGRGGYNNSRIKTESQKFYLKQSDLYSMPRHSALQLLFKKPYPSMTDSAVATH